MFQKIGFRSWFRIKSEFWVYGRNLNYRTDTKVILPKYVPILIFIKLIPLVCCAQTTNKHLSKNFFFTVVNTQHLFFYPSHIFSIIRIFVKKLEEKTSVLVIVKFQYLFVFVCTYMVRKFVNIVLFACQEIQRTSHAVFFIQNKNTSSSC